MAGGDAADVAALDADLRAARPPDPCRAGGSGQLAKLANQLIVASNICAVAEALLLAEQGGADPAKVREALLGGFADSTVLRQHGQRMVEGDFVPGGPAKYQIKDTGTALALAQRSGSVCPSPNEVDRLFRGLVDAWRRRPRPQRRHRRTAARNASEPGRSPSPDRIEQPMEEMS